MPSKVLSGSCSRGQRKALACNALRFRTTNNQILLVAFLTILLLVHARHHHSNIPTNAAKLALPAHIARLPDSPRLLTGRARTGDFYAPQPAPAPRRCIAVATLTLLQHGGVYVPVYYASTYLQTGMQQRGASQSLTTNFGRRIAQGTAGVQSSALLLDAP